MRLMSTRGIYSISRPTAVAVVTGVIAVVFLSLQRASGSWRFNKYELRTVVTNLLRDFFSYSLQHNMADPFFSKRWDIATESK